MRIYSWNVNGIRAVFKKDFLDWVHSEEPDILCLQETKIQEDQLTEDMINIDGYYSYFSFAEKKGYSGVAVYTKEKPLSVKHGIGISEFDSEGRILILEYPKFVLLNIYFPNGQRDDIRLNYKLDFSEAMLEYCNNLREMGKKIIMCGDYNTAHKEIDLKNPKENEGRSGFLPIEREWVDKLISNGYIDTFRYFYPEEVKYSWWTYRFKARERGVGWRIDYHFVSDDLIKDVRDAGIMDEVMGSDHCPVVLVLNE